MIDVTKMTNEELKIHLADLRGTRKRGYEAPTHKSRKNNPFADVDPEVVKKVLAEMQRRKDEEVGS